MMLATARPDGTMPDMARSLGRYLAEQLILKVTLAGSSPPIWRRVEVHSGLTLHELHYVLQCLFEWDDSHLYQFIVPPQGKLTLKAMRDAIRYHVMPTVPAFADMMEEDGRADEAIIGRIFTPECKQIVYEYDPGDSWEHVVKLEKRTPGGDQSHVPQCLAGENAAPFDDMGGIAGYYHWLEALESEDPDSREEAAEVLGSNFNPAQFDLDLVNKRLRAAFAPAPKKKPRRKRKDG